MKKIAINDKNADRITEAIKAVEGRASVRKVTYNDIVKALQDVEKHLGITKAAMKGITVTIDINAQDFPNAYKYIPESTIFEAEKTAAGWNLIDIYRGRTHSAASGNRVNLTEEAKAAIIATRTRF